MMSLHVISVKDDINLVVLISSLHISPGGTLELDTVYHPFVGR